MKRLILLIAAVTGTFTTANGQGTLYWANNSGSRVTNMLNMRPVVVGPTFSAALYYMPDTGYTPGLFDFWAGWIGLYPAVNCGPVPGIFIGGNRTAPPGIPPGGTAWFQIMVWESAFGSTFLEALVATVQGRGALLWVSDVMHVTVAGSGTTRITPKGFIPLIPEPTAGALGLLAVTLCWLVCRIRGQARRVPHEKALRLRHDQTQPQPNTLS